MARTGRPRYIDEIILEILLNVLDDFLGSPGDLELEDNGSEFIDDGFVLSAKSGCDIATEEARNTLNIAIFPWHSLTLERADGVGRTPILQQFFETNEAYGAVLSMDHSSVSGNAATAYPQRAKVFRRLALRAVME